MTKQVEIKRFLDTLEDIPCNSQVCLYGAGEGGSVFKQLLETKRKDVKIVCFIDDFKSGTRDRIRIVKAKDFFKVDNCDKLILITSSYWRDIDKRLCQLKINNYMIVNPSLFFASQIFTEEEERIYEVNFEKVKNLLSYTEDQRLYGLLIQSRKKTQQTSYSLYEYYLGSQKQAEYLDFINKKKINTIIEGGVFDGKNTLEFLRFLAQDGFLYGFEPFYEVYLESKNSTFLKNLSNVKIYPLALWRNKTQVMFLQDKDNKGGSRIVYKENLAEDEDIVYVEAISIDEFVADNHIEKIDYIKLDVEGAELEVLRGAQKTLTKHRPQLAVCIYHKKEDLFEIPLFLKATLKDYIHRIGHYSSTFWNTIWYAIPKEVYIY